MAYTLKGVAGQRYGELSSEEQARVQGAGEAHVAKIRSTLQPTWSAAHTAELLSGAERDAEEIAQRTAEAIFTQKSDAMRLAERAKETGTATIGNADTIAKLQAQGQEQLLKMQPNTPAAQENLKNLGTHNTANAANAGVVPTFSPSATPEAPAGQIPVQVGGGTAYVPAGSAGAANLANMGTQNTAQALNSKSQEALANLKASGVIAPDDGGNARSMVETALGPKAEVNPVLDTLFQEDKNLSNFSKQIQDYLNPTNQQQTLKQEYESLVKSKGIEGMNTELMNMKNIIEGAEDDIRTEITKAGGFATDSQVLALTNARNKTLIKNYNNLLQTKQQAEDYVNNLMDLTKEDRKTAQQRLDSQMDLSFKVLDYQQKMQKNARDAYQNMIDNVEKMGGNGYAQLYQATQGNPYYVSLVESGLGLPAGQLQQLAILTPSKKDNLQFVSGTENQPMGYFDKSTGKFTQLAGGGGGTGGGKKLSVSEAEALGVPYGTTEVEAQKKGIIPGATSGVPDKIVAKIQSSPENKSITAVLPAITNLISYKDAISKFGTSEVISGAGKGELKGTYGNALATWKSLAALGALSGADFALAENAVPETGFFQRSSTMQAKLDASIKSAVDQAEVMSQRLKNSYPEAANLIDKQLDDIKLTAYPEQYQRGPDGNVYKIKK